MKVEIAICTFNRARLLRKTLEGISQVQVPSEVALRVIVVNNNSADETDLVVQSFSRAFKIDLVHESRQGHALARNRAIDECRGELLIWTDDDVLVDDGWLAAYVDAARQQSDRSFWGGKIEPFFTPARPRWIGENWDKLKGCFAERDLGDQPIEFSADVLPYGANFAIRTSLQQRFRFDADLGRSACVVLGEDELQLFRRLLHDGHRGAWVPSAKLRHVIDSSRQSEKFVKRYFIGQGQALVKKGTPWSTDLRQLHREANWELGCYYVKRLFVGSETWVSHLIRGSLALGQYQSLRQARDERLFRGSK